MELEKGTLDLGREKRGGRTKEKGWQYFPVPDLSVPLQVSHDEPWGGAHPLQARQSALQGRILWQSSIP